MHEVINDFHPSVLQTKAHDKVSEKYRFVPSMQVLEVLDNSGWKPVSQKIARVRNREHEGYQTHMIRLRHEEFTNAFAESGECPEIVFRNEHKGSSALLLLCGVFRFVCANGLVLGETWSSYRIPHIGFADETVYGALQSIVTTIPKVMKRVNDFKRIELSLEERKAYAVAALILRHGEEYVEEGERLILPCRTEDEEPSLWNSFNTVQERLVKGKYRARKADEPARWAKKRPRISGVDADIRLNRALWHLTEKMADSKGIRVDS